MLLGPVNWLAIIVATLASMALGFGWYALLAKQWVAALGRQPMQPGDAGMGNSPTPFIWSALMQLVMAYFLALLTAKVFGATNVGNAVQLGFWLWLGFVLTSMITNHRYQQSKWSLTIIDAGYMLGVLLVQGVVIGLFG
ncbi:MAG: DUF1761 domain-containing protein [Devosia sp.]